ncbi:MAG: YkgJ family cysteine cluster protein [Rhodopseudomonas sp.]|uniref:YkgJ family cysteine cluster protein n=1 Tax=Rhodopseudomonas sp. TaxID=1078 RepID=UPI0017D70C64|nr:YkgJ family cysteine cluster protein [Rhodopseudomonas sp.]NVN88688.1 YkgJ family cysteine cluster protein [Rhodopseudomonas sp.]
MLRQQAIDEVSADIAEVGTLMRALSGRYEGIFSNLHMALAATLARSGSMADAARDAAAIADAAAAALHASLPQQPVYACGSGCNACCHLYVKLPPGVAAAIAQDIETRFTSAERDALQGRLLAAAAATNAAPNPAALRLRCPLLGDDDRCSVYQARPPSCRAFTSTSVARCRQVVFDAGSPDIAVEQNPAHFRVYREATFALEQAARARGLPDQQIGLAQALLDAMTPAG